MKKKAVAESEINLLDLVPVRNIEWKKSDDGFIILLKPKYRNSFVKKHILPRMKHPYFKIKLDENGSFLWEQIDGERHVSQIAPLFKEKFGDKIEPLFERLSIFFQHLERNKFIKFTGFPDRK